jgi:hypothetical protein
MRYNRSARPGAGTLSLSRHTATAPTEPSPPVRAIVRSRERRTRRRAETCGPNPPLLQKGDRGCSPRAAHGRLGPTYGAVAPAVPWAIPRLPPRIRGAACSSSISPARGRRRLGEPLAHAPLRELRRARDREQDDDREECCSKSEKGSPRSQASSRPAGFPVTRPHLCLRHMGKRTSLHARPLRRARPSSRLGQLGSRVEVV